MVISFSGGKARCSGTTKTREKETLRRPCSHHFRHGFIQEVFIDDISHEFNSEKLWAYSLCRLRSSLCNLFPSSLLSSLLWQREFLLQNSEDSIYHIQYLSYIHFQWYTLTYTFSISCYSCELNFLLLVPLLRKSYYI